MLGLGLGDSGSMNGNGAMRVRSLLGVSLTCLWLGGCAIAGLGGSDSALTTFNLMPSKVKGLPASRLASQVTVSPPAAMRALDSERILVSAPGGRISYFAGAAWSDRLPRLVHSRLVEALQDCGAFRAVLTSQDRVDGEYTIATEIRAFGIDVGGGRATANVAIFAKIVDERRGRVVATREFSASLPASADEAGASIAALQDGFNQVTNELVRWAASPRLGSSA
jgi:cholesterol transport system auxiliary component